VEAEAPNARPARYPRDPFHQVAGSDAEGTRQFDEGVNARGAGASLYLSDLGSVERSAEAEFFLR